MPVALAPVAEVEVAGLPAAAAVLMREPQQARVEPPGCRRSNSVSAALAAAA
jgi:hypothetical protein